jgi:iron(II)-dependent oxidoreductase
MASGFWDGTMLARLVDDARDRTLCFFRDLDEEQQKGPRLPIVNPAAWEIPHIAWFQERWVLRHARGEGPIHDDADQLYDSSTVPHEVRWNLPLYPGEKTVAYLEEVRARVRQGLIDRDVSDDEAYFVLLSVFHEDMHQEALLYTRQTLGYPPPAFLDDTRGGSRSKGPNERPSRETNAGSTEGPIAGPIAGDVVVPGGTFLLGASRAEPFVFDNEKWGHEVAVTPFAIARAPVTQREMQGFVDDGGYRRPELWTKEGWAWRVGGCGDDGIGCPAEGPVYWRKTDDGTWQRRVFDRWTALEPCLPVIHVSAHEAEAYCRWRGRRLPSETEWEMAASLGPGGGKRRFPWGDEPDRDKAHLDARTTTCVSVEACQGGDSLLGCRQMIGNVWEWTSSSFRPYPGFVRDPYQEYSEPWFHTHRVLRGGCFATRQRLIRNTWRNFYPPHRRDVWAGFRTCALGTT